ncbi:MAG: hypothetical protein O2871_02715 [bacterium]|nr:hypothetical protein [bacterium]
MSEIIKNHLAARKFLTKAKYLTKDFIVPKFTGTEEDLPTEKEKLNSDVSLSTLIKRQQILDKDIKEFKQKNLLDKTEPNKNIKNTLYGAVKMNPKNDYRFRSFDGVNTWAVSRDTATTPEEKNNIKQILNKSYSNPRQRASMADEDLRFINKHPTQLLEIENKKKAAAEETARFERDLAAMREIITETEAVDRSFEKFLEELNSKKKDDTTKGGLAYLLGMD